MATTFNLPDKLQVSSGNLSENWRSFQQSLDIYLLASGLDNTSDERRIAILLNIIGESGLKIYNNFSFEGEKSRTYDEVIKRFCEYCEPKKNVLHSRFLFYNRKQEDSEPFDNFLTDIKKLSKDCKFKSDEEAIRDRLVLGTNDLDTQRKLIVEGDAELDTVITKLRLAEIGRRHATEVQGKVVEVDKVEKSKPFIVVKCKWCGQQHERKLEVCPARGKMCTKCNKYNHFATVCRSRFVKTVANDPLGQMDNDDEFFCGGVQKTFIAVLSLAVAASAIPLVPVAKLAYAEPEAPAHYEFEYSVHDTHSGDVKQQKESRAGDAVQGSYSLLQPDGTVRIVDYTADKEHGFNAIVRYEGHPTPAPAKLAYAPVAKVAYAAPVAKLAYAAPVAKFAYSAPVAKVAYAAPVAKLAYAAPVAKVTYSAPLAQVTFSSPAISYHH